jgi:hypothetical protein
MQQDQPRSDKQQWTRQKKAVQVFCAAKIVKL